MKYLIVPDLHGQYYTFKSMLKKFININNDDIIVDLKGYTIVLLGDLIDKGEGSEQELLINFVYKNLDKFIIILGNHEHKTAKKIKDKNFVLSSHYDFYKLLENSKELTDKFIKINKKQIKYYETDYFICTHSPCLELHILKKNGFMTQYPFNRKKENENNLEYLEYIKNFFTEIVKEREKDKLHIFGHLGFDNIMINGNQIWLDSYDIKDLTFLEIEKKVYKFHQSNEKKEIVVCKDYKECLDRIIKNF